MISSRRTSCGPVPGRAPAVEKHCSKHRYFSPRLDGVTSQNSKLRYTFETGQHLSDHLQQNVTQ